MEKEIDILVGLNMNHLHPTGGQCDDQVGGLQALFLVVDGYLAEFMI